MNFRKIFGALLICVVYFASTCISSMAASSIEKVDDQNPYIQEYFKEKNSNPAKGTSETLVDPLVEEKIILSTLQEYYNEDVKVAGILKKFIRITELTNKTTSIKKEDKINIMYNIKKVYPDVKEESDREILKGYLKRYAINSEDEVSISFLNELIPPVKSINRDKEKEDLIKQNKESMNTLNTLNTASVTATSSYEGSYSGSSAATWAYGNYNKYSTNFPKLTEGNFSDCTNFVSQAMNVGGGMQTQGTWYCYKKNSTYLTPADVTQLNYSWNLANPSPWISVAQFRSFWSSRATSRLYSYTNYNKNHESIFWEPIYRGDAVILHKGVWGWSTIPTHAMIISLYDYTNKDFLLAAHSNERQAYPLLSAIGAYSAVEFISF